MRQGYQSKKFRQWTEYIACIYFLSGVDVSNAGDLSIQLTQKGDYPGDSNAYHLTITHYDLASKLSTELVNACLKQDNIGSLTLENIATLASVETSHQLPLKCQFSDAGNHFTVSINNDASFFIDNLKYKGHVDVRGVSRLPIYLSNLECCSLEALGTLIYFRNSISMLQNLNLKGLEEGHFINEGYIELGGELSFTKGSFVNRGGIRGDSLQIKFADSLFSNHGMIEGEILAISGEGSFKNEDDSQEEKSSYQGVIRAKQLLSMVVNKVENYGLMESGDREYFDLKNAFLNSGKILGRSLELKVHDTPKALMQNLHGEINLSGDLRLDAPSVENIAGIIKVKGCAEIKGNVFKNERLSPVIHFYEKYTLTNNSPYSSEREVYTVEKEVLHPKDKPSELFVGGDLNFNLPLVYNIAGIIRTGRIIKYYKNIPVTLSNPAESLCLVKEKKVMFGDEAYFEKQQVGNSSDCFVFRFSKEAGFLSVPRILYISYALNLSSRSNKEHLSTEFPFVKCNDSSLLKD